jgi:alkanesulfonate monooxygenase SsuD/methylene tetrahydromethanopterin reductase-like flavin-dependent oxidoreductase (luciferase family)
VRMNLMIEGQESVTWPQWTALAAACEEHGLEGLFRSDHYQSVSGHTERSSLDAWATLAALGPLTERIRLGTMVSPTSFRHPSVLAKNAVTADHTSGGRVELGIGAGWHDLEHETYGFAFHDLGTRFDVFEEQLEIVARQLTQERFDFAGEHYTLTDCEARPGPVQDRLPIIVGGNAGPRSVRNAVAWADEYNTVFPTNDEVAERRADVVTACERAGREPLTFSIMTGCLVGADEAELHDRAARLHELSGADGTVDAWLDGLRDSWVVGTVEQVGERLEDLSGLGVDRIMLQHQLHDDVDMVALLGQLT